MTKAPLLHPPVSGRLVGTAGDILRFLAISADTDGKYSQWENTVPPGGGPPPHIHTREEETFFVIEGLITFQVGDEQIVAGPGTFAHMPVGVPHTFRNNSDRDARLLITVVPAGLEEMFFEVGTPLTPGQPPVPITPDEIQRLLATAPKYGIQILPPPQH